MTFASPSYPSPAGRPAPKPGRPTWHWLLLGGAGLMVLLVALLVAAIILWQILGRGNPENTLDDFYSALRTSDCELFEQATSEVTGVDYEVTDRVNRFGYAIFYVTERYEDGGQTVEVPLRYYIERSSGQWNLAGIELVDEDAPDPLTGS